MNLSELYNEIFSTTLSASRVIDTSENTFSLWLVVATALVLSMQAGFLLVEAGSVRSKNTINVAQKNIADLIVCGCVFLLIGGPLMYGAGSTGWFGFGGYDLGDSRTRLLYLFQFAFCATAATIVSGAVSERLTFVGYITTTAILAGFTYPIFGHLVWGNLLIEDNRAWLTNTGFLDYAGSTVVHVIGGAAALALVIHIGPRTGRFDANGKPVTMRGHSSVLALQGTLILAVGWIGFNTGAAKPGTDVFSMIALNTVVAMCFGGMAGLIYGLVRSKGKVSPKSSICGLLGGLVSVTAGAAYYNHYAAMIAGFVGGLAAVWAAEVLLHRFKIDDPVDAIAIHMVGGIVGTLLVGVLADVQFLDGTRNYQIIVQFIGVMMACGWAFCTTYIGYLIIRNVLTMRVTPEEEEIGLNIVEHDDSLDVAELKEVLINAPAAVKQNMAHEGIGGEDIGDCVADSSQELSLVSKVVKTASAAQAAKEAAEEEMEYLAMHDHLTGLCNRRSLADALQEMIEQSGQDSSNIAILSMDLDGFKAVNDAHGHHLGDDLLKIVSERLKDTLPEQDVVARVGGDEFVIARRIEPDLPIQELKSFCKSLIDSVGEKIVIDGIEIFVGVSIGVAMYPEHSSDVDDLLRQSDMALYEAKQRGRGRWVVFRQELQDRANRRRRLEIDMRNGITRNEFFIEYQPQVSIQNKQLTGFEALMRWEHPEFGRISPLEFIPVAEETGLIVQLSDALLFEACKAASQWPSVKGKRCKVSVNVSPIQFFRKDMCDQIENTLAMTGLPAELLELEITESTLMRSTSEVINVLTKLREIGVCIAVDDFGTGYSSLNYLQQFPIDRLKVDRAFVKDLDSSQSDQRITNAIVQLGKSLGLNVIAEGVETHEQRKILSSLACDEVQGYLYSKPVELAQVLNLIVAANISGSVPEADQVDGTLNEALGNTQEAGGN